MQYRSTNTLQGFNHHGGALVVGVEAGSGIEINPTSSGVAPIITAAGDETDKSIQIMGKGAGGVLIGTSTSPTKGFQQYLIQWTPAALAATAGSQSTITVTGLATNSALFFTPMTPGISVAYAYRVQCSTANELRFTQQNITGSTIGTGESTARGLLLEFKF